MIGTYSTREQPRTRTRKSPARGQLSLSDLRGPLIVCGTGGWVESATAQARALLQAADRQLPTRIPPALWSEIQVTTAGQTVEWWSEDAAHCVALRAFPAGQKHFLLSLEDTQQQQSTLSSRVYRSTHELFGRLLAGAAHDLRSPLSGITFNVEVLRERWQELPVAQVRQLLEGAAARCRVQERSIAGLLGSTRQTERIAFQLGEIFDRLAQMLRPLVRERGSSLRIDVDRSVAVQSSRLAMDHIFANLLTNALESTSGTPVNVRVRSRIDAEKTRPVRTRRPTLKLRRLQNVAPVVSDERFVSIIVEDDGPGISAEARKRLFQPFFSTKVSGTGLGLCLAREAARQLGGDIYLMSQPGVGAAFEVRLPIVAAEQGNAVGR